MACPSTLVVVGSVMHVSANRPFPPSSACTGVHGVGAAVGTAVVGDAVGDTVGARVGEALGVTVGADDSQGGGEGGSGGGVGGGTSRRMPQSMPAAGCELSVSRSAGRERGVRIEFEARAGAQSVPKSQK